MECSPMLSLVLRYQGYSRVLFLLPACDVYHGSRDLSWQQEEESQTEEAVETAAWSVVYGVAALQTLSVSSWRAAKKQWIRAGGDAGKGLLELPSLEAEAWNCNCGHYWGPRAPAPSLIAESLVGTRRCSWEPKTAPRAECCAVDRQKSPGSELHAERLKHKFLTPKTSTSHKAWKLLAEPYSWFPVRASVAGKKLIWIRTEVLSQVPYQVPCCRTALVSSTLDFLNVLGLLPLKDYWWF